MQRYVRLFRAGFARGTPPARPDPNFPDVRKTKRYVDGFLDTSPIPCVQACRRAGCGGRNLGLGSPHPPRGPSWRRTRAISPVAMQRLAEEGVTVVLGRERRGFALADGDTVVCSCDAGVPVMQIVADVARSAAMI
ncbi:hypothetical protein SLS62_003377 [Diatrype stigma]|uniref:Uncharacterized protein n=1 Tax=Diatrype stigma TaxID=117547 RepID=A0AAN9YUB1_9PEZI